MSMKKLIYQMLLSAATRFEDRMELWKFIIRHAPSLQNTGLVESALIGDFLIPVDPKTAIERGLKLGQTLGSELLLESLAYSSGYMRPRQTFALALVGAGLATMSELPDFQKIADIAIKANEANKNLLARAASNEFGKVNIDAMIRQGLFDEQRELAEMGRLVECVVRELARKAGILYYEDLRLREVDHGRGDNNAQQIMRAIHSPLFYRFDEGGEDGADAFGDASSLLETVHRQAQRKRRTRILMFGHGLTNRVLVMRDLHLTIEEFQTIRNPDNCDIFTVGPRDKLPEKPQFVTGRQGVIGLRLGSPLL